MMARGTWKGSGTWQTTSGGGGPVLALIALLILIGSGTASAIASAIVTLLIIVGVLIGLAVLGGAALLVYRVHRARRVEAVAARPVYQLAPQPVSTPPDSGRLAIEPPREVHLHFH